MANYFWESEHVTCTHKNTVGYSGLTISSVFLVDSDKDLADVPYPGI